MDENVYCSGDFAIRSPRLFAKLRALLYAGGIERCAVHRGFAERNFRADGAADVYVSRHHMVGLQEAKPIQAGH